MVNLEIIWSQILFWLQAIKSPWANQQQQGRFKEKPTRLGRRWSLVAQRSEQLRYVAQRRKGPQNWTSTDNVNFHYGKVFQNWAGFFFPNIVYIYILYIPKYFVIKILCWSGNGVCGFVYPKKSYVSVQKTMMNHLNKPIWSIGETSIYKCNDH